MLIFLFVVFVAKTVASRAHFLGPLELARDTMESLASYGWIVICSGFLAFFTAFGIGAPSLPRRLPAEGNIISTKRSRLDASRPPKVSERLVRPGLSLSNATTRPRSPAHALRSSSSVLSGANDVSNAFATSVGSGALTLRDAVAIAAMLSLDVDAVRAVLAAP